MKIDIQPDEIETIATALRHRAYEMSASPLFHLERDAAQGLLILANRLEERLAVAAQAHAGQNDEDG